MRNKQKLWFNLIKMVLRNYPRKMCYLRRPYLIKRAILLPLEVRESTRHCRRVSEYKQYSCSPNDGVKILTGQEWGPILKELEDSDFLEYIKCVLKWVEIGGPMGIDKGKLLYCLVRAWKPEVVVETGVGNGVSSAFILKALDENAKGRLYSIDLHYRSGVSVPLGKHLGWIIPEQLKDRWNLVLGESTKIMPRLLKELISIDIFLHDSRHTYRTMMKEYSIAWPYLRDKSLLLSDDVECNDAFLDFADQVGIRPMLISKMGIICKDSRFKVL